MIGFIKKIAIGAKKMVVLNKVLGNVEIDGHESKVSSLYIYITDDEYIFCKAMGLIEIARIKIDQIGRVTHMTQAEAAYEVSEWSGDMCSRTTIGLLPVLFFNDNDGKHIVRIDLMKKSSLSDLYKKIR